MEGSVRRVQQRCIDSWCAPQHRIHHHSVRARASGRVDASQSQSQVAAQARDYVCSNACSIQGRAVEGWADGACASSAAAGPHQRGVLAFRGAMRGAMPDLDLSHHQERRGNQPGVRKGRTKGCRQQTREEGGRRGIARAKRNGGAEWRGWAGEGGSASITGGRCRPTVFVVVA